MSNAGDDLYEASIERCSAALSALTCPYRTDGRQCESGCYAEPSCIVDTPVGGWERELADAAAVLLRLRNDGAGAYARNQRDAIEHIRALPPSERSAVANRPGQTSAPTHQSDSGSDT